MKRYMLLGFVLAVLIGTGLAQNPTISDVNAFQQALEKDGFTVQRGALGFFDLIKLYDLKVLPNALGNNPIGHRLSPPLSSKAFTVDVWIKGLTIINPCYSL